MGFLTLSDVGVQNFHLIDLEMYANQVVVNKNNTAETNFCFLISLYSCCTVVLGQWIHGNSCLMQLEICQKSIEQVHLSKNSFLFT